MRCLAALLLLGRGHGFLAPRHAPLARVARRAPVPLRATPVDASPSLIVAALVDAQPVDKSGWFGSIVQTMETIITFLHDVVGSYGVAIVLFTIILKALTFPLNYAQIESTTKMQQLQPAIKKIQATYAADPDKMNVMMAELYKENELNPLAGCLPSLLQIPIFIALYRALLSLAREDLLEEPFLWIPNLEGPVFGAQNADWLLKFSDWNGSVPPLGWSDTAAYLALPCLLVVAQSISTQLLTPPATDENAASNNAVLKFLPLLVGFFSLNVPAGLTIYWFCNNLVTTASTLYIKSTVSAAGPVTMGGGAIAVDPPKKKKKKAKKAKPAFDDLLVEAPKADAVVDVAAVVEDAEAADEADSKSAAKKRERAKKSRRSKKSRK